MIFSRLEFGKRIVANEGDEVVSSPVGHFMKAAAAS